MKLSDETAEAVSRLRTNTDFQSFLKTLSDYGESLVEQMIYAKEARQLSVLQGRTQAVTEILKVVTTAPDKVKRTRENTL